MIRLRISMALGALLLGGCASYVTPGSGVSIPAIIEPEVANVMAREPAATFPARLVVVRVQGANYYGGYGNGNYSVMTTRDLETEADLARLGAMPGVAGIAGLNRLLVPRQLNTTAELRAAAAQLRADVVMLYTIDTAFHVDTQQIGPLQLVSLGFFPNKKAKVQSSCAVAFIDTRTGFIYGVAEATASEEQRSDLWNKEAAIEKARTRAERAAFTKALGEVEKTWTSIVAEHQKRGGGSLANPTP